MDEPLYFECAPRGGGAAHRTYTSIYGGPAPQGTNKCRRRRVPTATTDDDVQIISEHLQNGICIEALCACPVADAKPIWASLCFQTAVVAAARCWRSGVALAKPVSIKCGHRVQRQCVCRTRTAIGPAGEQHATTHHALSLCVMCGIKTEHLWPPRLRSGTGGVLSQPATGFQLNIIVIELGFWYSGMRKCAVLCCCESSF